MSEAMGQGQDFRTLREAAGLQQKELAKLLGKAISSTNRWEKEGRGDYLPAPDYAVAVLEMLRGLTADQRARVVEAAEASPGWPQVALLAAAQMPVAKRRKILPAMAEASREPEVKVLLMLMAGSTSSELERIAAAVKS